MAQRKDYTAAKVVQQQTKIIMHIMEVNPSYEGIYWTEQ